MDRSEADTSALAHVLRHSWALDLLKEEGVVQKQKARGRLHRSLETFSRRKIVSPSSSHSSGVFEES